MLNKRYLQMGRTLRRRKRNRNTSANSYIEVDSKIVNLLKWMKREKFDSKSLATAIFSDTGRGIMTKSGLSSNEMVISVPGRLLITTQTVLSSYLGDYIRRWRPHLSPLQVLCLYLICERHRGDDSFWSKYIGSLPTSYSTPIYWADGEIVMLPMDVKDKALQQVEDIRNLYKKTQPFWAYLSKNIADFKDIDILDFESFIWAWNVVNTRSVYMKQPQCEHLSNELDHYALAPFLDLLNHTTEARVKAGFNYDTNCYEIITLTQYKKYEQVFINYGPHDNAKLLVEYGFVLPNNPHNTFRYDVHNLRQLLKEKVNVLFEQKKCELIMNQGYHENLTCSLDGLSWAMITSLQIFVMDELKFRNWTKFLQYTYDKNYDNMDRLARDIANHILETSLRQLDIHCNQFSSPVNISIHMKMAMELNEQYRKILLTSIKKLYS